MRCAVWMLTFVAVGFTAASVRAGGSVQQASGYGLRLTVDTRWPEGQGYRPVRVNLTPLAILQADRAVTIELLISYWGGSESQLRVRQTVELPAGSGPVDATIAVPLMPDWAQLAVEVYEDGVPLPKLGLPMTGWGGPRQGSESLPAVLVCDPAADTTALASAFPSHWLAEAGAAMPNYFYAGPGQPRTTTPRMPGGLPTAFPCPPADLPTRWIDYSSLDIVFVSLADLKWLERSRADALQALADWTAAGGNLCVYGVSYDVAGLGELHRLLGLPAAEARLEAPGKPGWRVPNPTGLGHSLRMPATHYGPGGQVMIEDTRAFVTEPPMPERSPRPSDALPSSDGPLFALRGYGLGQIAAIAAEKPFLTVGLSVAWGTREWTWLLNSLGPEHANWSLRHGLSLYRDNADFWNFLIPGVGLAPVKTFCVLITVFVLAIGPVNYWLLRRWKRLHLLVITIPGGALVVTLALFAYALISDGLGTRVRARSLTVLDQRRGHAVCWTRLSYYAGLAPAGGLTFGPEVAALPLTEMPTIIPGYSSARSPRRDLRWDDQQHLASGWISSRTPVQYFTLRSHASKLSLEILASSAQQPPRVRNTLGVGIRQLLVRTRDGGWHWATDVAPGELAQLAPATEGDARGQLSKAALAVAPGVPPGIDTKSYGLFGMSRRQWYYYGPRRTNELGDPRQATSLLERGLLWQLAAHGRNGDLLSPGSYLAIVDESPEVVHGTPGAREESSYHAILGYW